MLAAVPVRRIPPVYVLYVALSILQPVLLVLLATNFSLSVSIAGITVAVVLLVGLAFGNPVAWSLLVLWNAWGLLGLAIAGDWRLADVLVVACTSVALVLTLLSPPMRRHVAARGLSLRRTAV
jgi:hypothetical protein